MIKFNVWEDTFEKSTKEVRLVRKKIYFFRHFLHLLSYVCRDLELRSLRQFLMLQALQSFLWNCAIFLVAFLSFSTYSILDTSAHRLTAQVRNMLNVGNEKALKVSMW